MSSTESHLVTKARILSPSLLLLSLPFHEFITHPCQFLILNISWFSLLSILVLQHSFSSSLHSLETLLQFLGMFLLFSGLPTCCLPAYILISLLPPRQVPSSLSLPRVPCPALDLLPISSCTYEVSLPMFSKHPYTSSP